MKTSTTSLAKFLPIIPLLLAAPAADAFVISFTGANTNGAVVSSTAVGATGPFTVMFATTVNDLTPAPSSTYTVNGDLDGDGTSDSLVIVFNLTANGTNNPSFNPNQSGAGYGVATSTGGNPDQQSGETLTIGLASITPVFSSATNPASNFSFSAVATPGNGTWGSNPPTVSGLGTDEVSVLGDGGRGGVGNLAFSFDVVPEPSSAMLLGSVGVLALLRRRR